MSTVMEFCYHPGMEKVVGLNVQVDSGQQRSERQSGGLWLRWGSVSTDLAGRKPLLKQTAETVVRVERGDGRSSPQGSLGEKPQREELSERGASVGVPQREESRARVGPGSTLPEDHKQGRLRAGLAGLRLPRNAIESEYLLKEATCHPSRQPAHLAA